MTPFLRQSNSLIAIVTHEWGILVIVCHRAWRCKWADRLPLIGSNQVLLGQATRTKEARVFPVGNGSLIIKAGTMQRFWKHEIPKTEKNVGEGLQRDSSNEWKGLTK